LAPRDIIPKMDKKILILILLGIFLIGIVSATEVSYCCEKTKVVDGGSGGASCIETTQENCVTGINPTTGSSYRKAPTSCESTSYCKKGVCIDGEEGTCSETYQISCQEAGGLWENKQEEDVPQCQLGCCQWGDQTDLVTLTRCKRLASLWGVENRFLPNIQNLFECVALGQAKDKGACIYEKDYEKTCDLITREECSNRKEGESYENVEFHAGYLCSATELSTNCGPSQKTTCVEKEDEVYFLDTCGNLANIYDSLKINDIEYWTYIKTKEESCNPNNGNINSKTCGNCDSFLRSTCMRYKTGQKPNYGDYICGSLDCEDADFKKAYGRNPKHGEKWCVTSSKENNYPDSPGSEHFRLSCYDGEINVEPCAALRAEICIQGEMTRKSQIFKTAECRVNRWQTCNEQDNKEDCENDDQRDCEWIEMPKISTADGGKTFKFSLLGTLTGEKYGSKSKLAKDGDGDKIYGSCVPIHSPGFRFWELSENIEGLLVGAEGICSRASTLCIVEYEKGFVDWEGSYPTKNRECLTNEWAENMNEICMSLGDCGSKVNLIGREGYHSGEAVIKGKRK